jgi:hypothetical protein
MVEAKKTAVAAAIFRILEMYTPFQGLIQISALPCAALSANSGPDALTELARKFHTPKSSGIFRRSRRIPLHSLHCSQISKDL